MTPPLFTIGYEGRSAEDLLEALAESNVSLLLDVRYRPQSRKPGLSKTKLSQALEDLGIGYYHDRSLGTPPEILKKERETGEYDWDAYLAFLNEQEEAVEEAASAAEGVKACLLCYEADASECHRRFVAEKLSEKTGREVIHLD